MKNHPILNCAPQAPYGKADETWVLIPALAWQVIIVESAIDRLDAFEKVIFDLMRSGDYSVGQLAIYTHLHPDLVMILIERLHGHGLLDKTDDGRYRAFKSKDDAKAAAENSGTQTVGWVFQQPWTGRLFPAFFPRLPVQPTSENGQRSGLKKLLFGDDANPLVRQAPALDFPHQLGSNPTPSDVIRLFGLHRSGEFKERLSGLRRIPFKDGSSQEFDYKKSVRKVKFLSPEPLPVYLATAGLVFKDDPSDWHVCCPVGTGLSQELRDQVLRCSDADDYGAVAVVKHLCEKTKLGNIYEWTQAHEDFLRHARRETLSSFGTAIEEYPDLLVQLDAFHDLWARLRSTDGEPPMHFLDSLCTVARKTLEALFKEFAKRRPFVGLDHLLVGKNEEEHLNLATEWIARMGYDSEGLNDVILVKKSWIKKEATDFSKFFSLKNVIGTLVVQGLMQEDHPLRIGVVRDRQFFAYLRRVMTLGNSSSHDNSHKSDQNNNLTKEVALSIREPLIQIIRSLLDPDGTTFKQD